MATYSRLCPGKKQGMADDFDRRARVEPPAVSNGIDSLGTYQNGSNRPNKEPFEANGTFSVRLRKECHGAAQYTVCAPWHFCVSTAIYRRFPRKSIHSHSTGWVRYLVLYRTKGGLNLQRLRFSSV